MPVPAIALRPCPTAEVEALAAALGVHRITAEALVRRGLGDPAAARAFLAAEGSLHDPLRLGAMADACALIEAAIASGGTIVVHGDYDADGICATAVAVEGLRALGATAEPFLPSRFAEGYGLAVETVESIAAGGAALLVTVDCGITAVDAAARAAELGLPLVVTDHHRAGDVLPDAPLVASRGPYEQAYPFADLCGTGVAFKLLQALWARRLGGDPNAVPAELASALDLVALATVADVVPLVDENRALVRAGMRRLARGARPGLAALMRSSKVDRARVRSSDLGFRLGPRLNAAGRLGHPGRALELLLAPDEATAEPLAQELELLNRERQDIEASILRAAVAEVERAPEAVRDAPALVVWGEGWHEGVVGIVASRLVDRYHRPAVVIAAGDGDARGSGRSIPAYDLHAGLTACAEHLTRFGGHRVAAGLSLRCDALEPFAAALRAHAAGQLGERELRRRHAADAVVAIGELSLELARELQTLEPHGLGNPAVTLLAPAVELAGVETMGEGRHLRFQVRGGAARCSGVAFGKGERAESLRDQGRVDALVRLEVNEWNGAVSQRLSLRDALPLPAPEAPVPGAATALPPPRRDARPPGPGPRVHDLRGRDAAAATIGRLVASGEPTLVLVADLPRRRGVFEGPLDPQRYGAGEVVFAAAADGPLVLETAAGALAAGACAIAEHGALARCDALAAAARHVVVLDPQAEADEEAALRSLAPGVDLHLVYGLREIAFARRCAEAGAPYARADRLAYLADAERELERPLAAAV